jgi:hypothetical protein
VVNLILDCASFGDSGYEVNQIKSAINISLFAAATVAWRKYENLSIGKVYEYLTDLESWVEDRDCDELDDYILDQIYWNYKCVK